MSSTKQALKPPNPRSLAGWRAYEAEVDANKAETKALEKKMRGRPRTQFDEDAICQRISEGESLRRICRDLQLRFMTVLERVDSDPVFRGKYAHAKATQCENMVEKMVEIADSATGENAHAARLQIETRRWIVSKILSKKYGDKPADISVETHVHNHVPASRQKELQDRHARALSYKG